MKGLLVVFLQVVVVLLLCIASTHGLQTENQVRDSSRSLLRQKVLERLNDGDQVSGGKKKGFIGKTTKTIGKGVSDGVNTVGDGVSDGADTVGDGFSNTFLQVSGGKKKGFFGKTTKTIGKGVSDGAKTVGDGVSDGADTVGDAFSNTAFLEKTAKKIGKKPTVGDGVSDDASQVVKPVDRFPNA